MKHFGLILTIVGMLGGLLGVWGTISADNADTKRRVSEIERRHEETQKDYKTTVKEIKTDVKETKQDVQTVLRKLEVIEALQRRSEARPR